MVGTFIGEFRSKRFVSTKDMIFYGCLVDLNYFIDISSHSSIAPVLEQILQYRSLPPPLHNRCQVSRLRGPLAMHSTPYMPPSPRTDPLT